MIAAAITFSSCGGSKESGSQTPADELLSDLTSLIEEGKILFGHQDDLMYGHSWKLAEDASEYVQSDVKDVTGAYPAVLGLDLGCIELGSTHNLDNNSFVQMREAAVAHHERGGIVTFSWHPRNPLTGGDTWDVSSSEVVASILPGGPKNELFMDWLAKAADYMESIKTADGQQVPIIWRPWHEHTGSWFWWGRNLCTAEQYKTLWQMTYDYMAIERGMNWLVWSYSPNGSPELTAEIFAERYPSDEIIDMVGIDYYQFASNESFISDLKHSLDIAGAFAAEHKKLLAVTEMGYEGVKDAKWWTSVLYEAIKDYPVSYALVWRNACDADKQHHFYAPFPGHESAEDFKVFAELENIKFL